MIDRSRLANRALQIYANPSIRTGVVFSVDYLNHISSGSRPLLSFTFALDWIRDPGLRLEEILRSDYLFAEGDDRPISAVKINTFEQEMVAYNAWLRSLNEQHGIRWLKRGPLSVACIQNTEHLRNAFREFVAKHQWRGVFMRNNPEVLDQK